MKLYNFSDYAKRREEKQAAQAVSIAVAELHHPGSVTELKHRVNTWFALHQEVLRRANET